MKISGMRPVELTDFQKFIVANYDVHEVFLAEAPSGDSWLAMRGPNGRQFLVNAHNETATEDALSVAQALTERDYDAAWARETA